MKPSTTPRATRGRSGSQGYPPVSWQMSFNYLIQIPHTQALLKTITCVYVQASYAVSGMDMIAARRFQTGILTY